MNEATASSTDPDFLEVGEWVFLEIMGHRSHWGLLTEIERFGSKLARIDVYGIDDTDPRATHYYGGCSIFSITPSSSDACRKWVSRYEPRPALLRGPDELEDDEGGRF
jgi:hypothetical protein